jgi:putative serine protease PepD
MSDTPQDPSADHEPVESLESAQARLDRERDSRQTRPLDADASQTRPLNADATPANGSWNPDEPRNPDEHWAPAPPASPARSRNVGIVAALAIGALVGGVGGGVTAWSLASSQSLHSVNGAATSPQTITVNDASNATNVTAVAAKTGPSVVTVSVAGSTAAGTGSGVILSSDGYVVTNTHVVTLDGESNNTKIQVQTYDGHLYSAKLVGTDPITDLAVIKINSDATFQPADFADSSQLNVGDVTIAIGAPLGLANTVTNGIVSALDRSITVKSSAAPKEDSTTPDDGSDNGNGPFNFWENRSPGSTPPAAQATISLPVIQTDAAINPGNSGGALLDSEGKVIGINVAIASTGSANSTDTVGNIGVGFAVPSNLVKRIAMELKDSGSATHGLLGASVRDVSTDATLTSSSTVGAVVASVSPGGAAENAGIRKDDVIIKFNASPITGATDLTAQVRSVAAGSTAKVTYVRGGEANTVTVELGSLK